MLNDGAGNDQSAGDSIYTATVHTSGQTESYDFQVKVSKQGDTYIDIKPCSPTAISVVESVDPDLLINEFMAGNVMTLADEYGEYDDWAELYNADPNPVWLGDKYLTDDLGQPQRWLMPDHTLQPGEFYLIWTDDDNGQGENHTNFRLSKGGEELAIVESVERGSLIIDQITFGAQLDDISYGRAEDGGSTWRTFQGPTPGYSNLLTSSLPETMKGESLRVYPNPVLHGKISLSKYVSVRIYDVSGKLLLQKENVRELDISTFPSGLYLLRTYDGESVKIMKH
jgi:hypothetical protein